MPERRETESLSRRDAIKRLAVSTTYTAAIATSLSTNGCRKKAKAPAELIIKGGRVVTSSMDETTDLRIKDGKIVEIGKDLNTSSKSNARTLEAEGKIVLPGGVDPHVHLDKPWVDDFATGSRAALAGGITTVGHMCFPNANEAPLSAVKRTRRRAEKLAIADIFLHSVIFNPDNTRIDVIDGLTKEGFASAKFFMENSRFDNSIDRVSNMMRAASRLGLLPVIHAEDNSTLKAAQKRLNSANQKEIKYFPESRPVEAEVIAVQNAIKVATETGCPVYFVHISSGRALDLCRSARESGIPIFVETRPLYLHLTAQAHRGPEGAKYICMPPIREQKDQDALWAGLVDGSIQTIASDHASWTKKGKLAPNITINNPKGGVNNLQVMLPMLMDQGVSQGRITLQKFVEVTSTNAAKLFGLYPRKGDIAINSDADIVVWDPDRTNTVDGGNGFSKAGFSVFDGTRVTGWPSVTIRRGVVVFENEKIKAEPGTGLVLKQKQKVRTSPKLG